MDSEPWLMDDLFKPKIFTLAGFFPTPLISPQKIKIEKDEIIRKIAQLGGTYVDKDEWDPSVTHVITYVDGKKDGMSEKVMAGIAAGKWVLTKRYVNKSFNSQEWIQTPKLYVPNDAVLASRKKWHLQGAKGGPFWSMKAALVMEDERKRGVYSRIILAGGGEVKDAHSLRNLAGNPRIVGQLTHVFMDPWSVNDDAFKKIKSEAESKGLSIWFLHYKYLFLKVRGNPVPTELEHSVMNPQVRETGERERRQMSGQKGGKTRNKRPLGSEKGNSRKKQKSSHEDTDVVVVLESDDECTIIDDKPVEKNGKVPVDVSIDTDDDDDISVLVQKLASSRAEAGSGRQYMERGKATGVMQSYKEMCEQQRREQRGRRKSGDGRRKSQQNSKSKGGRNSCSVQIISISDDETEMVTIDDSDDEVSCVDHPPPSSASSARFLPRLERTPSPIMMELDQDEREDSGDEIEESETRLPTRVVETAPEVFDVDSGEEEDNEVQLVPDSLAPSEQVSPTFSSEDYSCPDSPGVEQGHASDTSIDRLNNFSVDSPRYISGTGSIKEAVEPSLEDHVAYSNKLESSQKSRRFEEIVEPSLDFYQDKRSEAEEIRKAIFSLARENVSPEAPTSLPVKDTTVAINRQDSKSSEKEIKSGRHSSKPISDIREQKGYPDPTPTSVSHSSRNLQSMLPRPETPSDISLKSVSELSSKNPDPQTSNLDDPSITPSIKLNLTQSSYTRVPELVVQKKLTEKSPAEVEASPLAAPSSPVPAVSQSVTKTTNLHRILATIVKRMTFTDEGIAITNINSRSARFDKHGERKVEPKVKQLNPNIEMDFAAYFIKPDEERIPVKIGKKKNISVEDDFKDEGITANDSVATIRRLIIETTSSAFPTSSILHVIMRKLLLEGTDQVVRIKACEFLNHFLFLHLGKQGIDRENWLILILSAMRTLPEMKMFKSFDIENSHDILGCYKFFKDAVTLLMTSIDKEENLQGPTMFFEFLVKLLQKDFEQWWKHWRKTDSSRSVSYPLVFYMLGGSRSTLVKNITKTVLKLYGLSLQESAEADLLPTIRKLVSISALLLSHLDSMDGSTSLYLGDKVILARSIGEVLEQTGQGYDIYIELSLLQPNWLSVLVSRYFMKKRVDVGESLACMKDLKLEDDNDGDKSLTRHVENWSHRLCGLQQAHAVFRANWHFVRDGGQFKDFKHLSRLEERGVSLQNKMVKMEDVGLRLSKLVESVNCIRDVANDNSVIVENLKVSSSLSALFFKMTFVDNF